LRSGAISNRKEALSQINRGFETIAQELDTRKLFFRYMVKMAYEKEEKVGRNRSLTKK
jgi:hypothetical protein